VINEICHFWSFFLLLRPVALELADDDLGERVVVSKVVYSEWTSEFQYGWCLPSKGLAPNCSLTSHPSNSGSVKFGESSALDLPGCYDSISSCFLTTGPAVMFILHDSV